LHWGLPVGCHLWWLQRRSDHLQPWPQTGPLGAVCATCHKEPIRGEAAIHCNMQNTSLNGLACMSRSPVTTCMLCWVWICPRRFHIPSHSDYPLGKCGRHIGFLRSLKRAEQRSNARLLASNSHSRIQSVR